MNALPRAGWLALGTLLAAVAVLAAAVTPGLSNGVPTARFWVNLAALIVVTAVGLGALLRGADHRWLALVAGVLAVLLRTLAGPAATPAGPAAPLPPEAATWVAQVESVGTPAGGSQRAIVLGRVAGDATPSLAPATMATGAAGAAAAEAGAPAASRSPLRLYVTLPRFPELAPGDVLRFTARAEAVPASGGFASYLRRLEIAGTALVREATIVGHLDDPLSRLARLRGTLGDWLARVLPEPQAGLAAGIVVGLRERVGQDVAADFTAAGLSHVVAISGWNIALVGGAVAAFARPLPRRRRSLVVVLAVVGYTLLAGAGPSVVRAAVMAALVLFAREVGRPGRATAVLGLAVAAMLLVDPAVVVDPGFQLSAAATAGLLAWSTPLEGFLVRHLPRRTPRWLAGTLGVSLAAQAATLPLVLLDFGRLSLVSPLANLVAAPLITPVMVAGIAALLVGGLASAGLPALLLTPEATLAAVIMGCLAAVAHAAASVPYASVVVPGPAGVAGALLALGGLAVAATATGRRWVRQALARSRSRRAPPPTQPRGSTPPGSPLAPLPTGSGAGRGSDAGRRRPLDRLLIAAALLPLAALLMTGLVVAGRADGRFHMVVLDVGQGDAILLTGDQGSRVLVDAGPDADRTLALLDGRLPAWDRRLDMVILTHPHEDHAGGLALLLERYRIGAIVETAMVGPGPGYHAFQVALQAAGRTSRRLVAGDRFRIDGAQVLVRWPPAGSVPREPPDSGKAINNVSIVLDVQYRTRRFLLAGDVEEEIDPQLLAGGIETGHPLDVLKVAHHGSRTSNTAELLHALRPRYAIVSAGAGNPYGHPAPETLTRLAAAGARILRTDHDGSVEVSSDGGDLRVQATGGRASAGRAAVAAQLSGTLESSASFLCGLATIAVWPSPIGTRPPPSSSSSRPARASWPTQALWPRSPPISPPASPPAAVVSTAASWKRPRSSTMSTSCCPASIRCAPSAMALAPLDGWPTAAAQSSLARSPPIRSVASSMTRRTAS